MWTETSPRLKLPLIQPSQAQKHVTHNEALRLLDVACQLTVTAPPQDAPPSGPAIGDCYIVGQGQGDWSGQDATVAVWTGGYWDFIAPQLGWRADVSTNGTVLRFDGTAWDVIGEMVPRLGVATSPDDTNRLAVSSPATLLTHAGSGHQLKLNKAGVGDTVSLLYQTNWSGRVEMGLSGSDRFALKVSEDGAAWHTAMEADPASGALQITTGRMFTREAMISNDAVWSFDCPFDDPARAMLWLGVDAPGHAYLFALTGTLQGTTNFAPMAVNPVGTLDFHTGALTGTTGAGGVVTVGLETGNGAPKLHIENRLGASHLFTLASLGA